MADETGSVGEPAQSNNLDDLNAKFGAGITIDPGSIESGAGAGAGADESIRRNKDGSVRRKPGRKPGVNYGASARKTVEDKRSRADGVESVLFSIHLMAAQFLSVPELAIEKEEAKKLSAAILAVQDFYNVKTSAEVLLWTQVGGALISVYGPRIGAAIVGRKNKNKANKNNEKGNVVDINNGKNAGKNNGSIMEAFLNDIPPTV